MSGKAPDEIMIKKWECEYRECNADRRHLTTLTWQVPSTIIVINGVLLSLAFGSLTSPLRGLVIIFGAFFSFILIWTLVKLAWRSEERRKRLVEIERVQGFRRMLSEEPWFIRRSTRYWLLTFLILFTSFLVYMGAINILPQ